MIKVQDHDDGYGSSPQLPLPKPLEVSESSALTFLTPNSAQEDNFRPNSSKSGRRNSIDDVNLSPKLSEAVVIGTSAMPVSFHFGSVRATITNISTMIGFDFIDSHGFDV